jgi:tRNA (guanosine-2'-O-)-methyltransferase
MTPERYRRIRAVLDRRQPDLTVLLEDVHKPHNFSAILRSCDAAGVFETHATSPSGRVRRHHPTSGGSGKWVGVRVHPTVAGALADLRERGLRILAAHPTAAAADFREEDYARPTAILLGQEKTGVSAAAAAGADGFVAIPMVGMVASLNVSVAAALILFEAQRQRAAAGLYDRPRLDEETYRRTLFEWGYPEIAAYCREIGHPYPRLDEEGRLLDPVPA